MAQKLSEQMGQLLTVYSGYFAETHERLVLDVSSWIGDQHITTTDGSWKATKGLSLTSKDNNKIQLPLNAPMSTLVWFAIRANELEDAADNEIQMTPPNSILDWAEKFKLRVQLSITEKAKKDAEAATKK